MTARGKAALKTAVRFAGQHEHLTAAALFALVLCVYFAPLFAGHQLGQSYTLFNQDPWRASKPASLAAYRDGQGDAAYQWHPLLSVARDQIRDGQLPLWNPLNAGGMPLLGDLQSGLLYPPTWLALALGFESAWGWMALVKLLIAGLGAYGLARTLGIRVEGGLVAGLAYMLCAPNAIWLQQAHGSEFALFPWLLLTTHRLHRRPGTRSVALLAVVVMLMLFAGQPEVFFHSSAAAALFLLVVSCWDRRPGPRARRAFQTAWRWLAGYALGLAAAAVVLIPFLQAYLQSLSRDTHNLLSTFYLPRWRVLTYALPTLFGNGTERYGFLYHLTAQYFGITVAVLAGVGLVRYRREPTAWALAALAFLSVALAYGVPPVRWFSLHVPPFSRVDNTRVLFIPALAAAIGAGAGLGSLLSRGLRFRRLAPWLALAVLGVGAGVAAASIRGVLVAPTHVEVHAVARFAFMLALGAGCVLAASRGPRGVAVIFVLAAVALDLTYVRSYNVILPPDRAHPGTPPSVRFLQRQGGTFRVSSLSRRNPPVKSPLAAAGRRGARRKRSVFTPNTTALYGLESVDGYDFPPSRRWWRMEGQVLGYGGLRPEILSGPPQITRPSVRTLRMLNARYYLAPPRTRAPYPGFEPVYRGSDATVFRDHGALPRAYVVERTRRLAAPQALRTLVDGRLDPRREALVPTSAPLLAGHDIPPRTRTEAPGPRHVQVDLRGGGGGWLVLANVYTRQWKAKVDGRPAKVFPTNYAALGVRIPRGARRVDFRLSATGFTVGAVISAVAVLVMLVLALVLPVGAPPPEPPDYTRARCNRASSPLCPSPGSGISRIAPRRSPARRTG